MIALDPAFSAALQDRYRIERELGRGGMATVYLAHDLKHGRPVALKVLHPELAATLGPERFQREIRFAARLQHPHILSVHDSGEAAGRLWFTMPLVEGESLRSRLAREGQLSIEDAVQIARESAEALDYAHRHGVVHRDIKPENILIAEDHALLADFGISRALGATGDRLTETGLVVGTPAYMSPEQATGAVVNGRTDIYGLGVVLYEMLAGEPPFTGPTAQAIIAKRMTGEIPSPRRVRPAIPEGVEQAVRKAMAPLPADRFGTAAAFARALVTSAHSAATRTIPSAARPNERRLPVSVTALGLGFLLGLGALFAWLRYNPSESSADPKRLAVLPFENLGSPEDEYFADGITDEVRGKLATLPALQVIASGSSSQYKRTTKPPEQTARELGVQYLLVGKVRWDKAAGGQSRVRVSPELVQVAAEGAPTTRWQQPFEAPLTDVFKVQSDIAGQVAQALDVALGSSERQLLAQTPTQDLAAYDAYLKGEDITAAMAETNPVALQRALSVYQRAVELDPGFVQAWTRLSQAHAILFFLSGTRRESREAALSAANEALRLAPGRPEGRLALGEYHYRVTNDYAQALEQYQLGRRAAPGNVEFVVGIALSEQNLGRWEESLAHLREAAALDPRSVLTARRLARTLFWMRRYPEALEAIARGLALAPTSVVMIQNKAMMLLAQGNLEGARAVVRAAPPEVDRTTLVANLATYWDLVWVLDREQQDLLLRLTPRAFDDDRAAWGLALAQVYALRGDRTRSRAYADSAQAAFEQQLESTPEGAQLHLLRGLALAYLGRKAEAVREGEHAVSLVPLAADANSGAYYQHQLARIYFMVGEQEKALDQLEPLLEVPYFLSPAWLRIDPTFDPLRKHPRFQALVR